MFFTLHASNHIQNSLRAKGFYSLAIKNDPGSTKAWTVKVHNGTDYIEFSEWLKTQ